MSHFEQEIIKDYCPYCGELIELLIDCSISVQEYIEDCCVCCRPIQVAASVTEDGNHNVILSDENS